MNRSIAPGISEQDIARGKEKLDGLQRNISSIIHGRDAEIRNIISAMISGGHVLLEDVPGTGKTTLAKAIAKSISDSTFKRIQFTPDLLPTDVLGVNILNPKDHVFEFHKGPVFTNILLADEINRASPRTQAALLEAMAEGQVTIEGEQRDLADFFFVIATQNPVEFRGTYPLPEAQMDRFAMQCSLGYVPPEDEVAILSAQAEGHPVETLEPVVDLQELLDIRKVTQQIRLSDELKRYIVDIVSSTRNAEHVQLAASPRASIALMKTAQSFALFDGSDFVHPQHIQDAAVDTISHRIVLDPQAKFSGISSRGVVEDMLSKIPLPA